MASQTAAMNNPAENTAAPQATSPTSNPSTHSAADAARAIERTNSWKPSFERRQSWNKEDQKRELQMSHIDTVKTGPGFTERG